MTATATLDTPRSRTATARRPGTARLTLVELRKMVDTRSGFWLPLAAIAITLITVVIASLVGRASGHTTVRIFHAGLAPDTFLLPVLGILLVCGEWTQRTTLTTFTLVPDRARVMGAKLLASIVLSVGALLVCLVLAELAGALLSNRPGGAGSIPVAVVGQSFLQLGTAMIMGVGFGAAILVSAPAIVAYLLLPTIWTALASNIHALATLDRWLDTSHTLDPLSRHALSATQWAHAGTSLALWMALPLAIGWWRIRRRDID